MTEMRSGAAGGLYSQYRTALPRVSSHLISSKFVAQDFRIDVMLPITRAGDPRSFPVIYATDGNLTFDVLKGMSLCLQAAGDEVHPFILVAIGYPSDLPFSGDVLRMRDLSFPGCPAYVDRERALNAHPGILEPKGGSPQFHGGPAFQRFIRHELMPFIDHHFPSCGSRRGYFGHSLGGGFGLFTLFTDTTLFSDYLISSPTVSYDGVDAEGTLHDHDAFMLPYAQDANRRQEKISGLNMYMSVGEREDLEEPIRKWEFVSGFRKLTGYLNDANFPNNRIAAEIIENERHSTVWPIAYVRGVRSFFGRDQRA